MRHTRTLLPALAALAMAVSGVHGACAQAAPGAPVPDPELADMRGGFEVGGVAFSFGATLNTLVDGQLALQTVVTYQPGGLTTTVTPGAWVTPVVGDQALAQLSGRGIAITPGSGPVYATTDGATAFIQGFTQQGLVNATLNTAAGRTITSNTDLTLVIPNGAAFQASVLNQNTFQSLSDQIALGVLANRH